MLYRVNYIYSYFKHVEDIIANRKLAIASDFLFI